MPSKIKQRIEKLELNNYRLYVFISILIGIVVFVLTFFTTSRIVTNLDLSSQKNKADMVFKITNMSDIGFDVEILSDEELKVRYFYGKTPDTLTLFFESKEFTKEETQQFRSIVPDSNKYVQIEIETRSGEKIRSKIINVNDMVK